MSKGIEESSIPKIFFFFILGGIISQYPIGALSDKLERRSLTSIVTFLAGCVAYCFTLPIRFSFQLETLFFVFGATVMPQYSLVMTHAMDKANQENASQISSQMLLLYSVGAIFGPITCGQLIKIFQANGQSYYLICVFVIMLVFGLQQRIIHAPVDKESKEKFRIFPELSPVIFIFNKLKKSILE